MRVRLCRGAFVGFVLLLGSASAFSRTPSESPLPPAAMVSPVLQTTPARPTEGVVPEGNSAQAGTQTSPDVSGGASPATTPAPEKPKFEIVWNNGLYLQTPDKQFVSHWGATAQYDFAWYSASTALEQGRNPGEGIGKFHDGVNFRRARIFTEGTLWDTVDYKLEIEFMNGIGFSPVGTTNLATAASITNSPGPTDAWLNIKDVPFLGNIRIGNQKEWFSLEHLNNYRALEFLERSYLFDFAQSTAFNNGFTPGISAFRTWAEDRIFTAIGMYKNESDLIGFGLGDGQYAVTGRLAALPLWRPDDKVYWHVGGAMSHRDPVEDSVQIRIRSNVRNAPFPLLPLLVNTGLIDAKSQDLFNLETAAVWGPLTFQAEYTANLLHDANVAATPTKPAGPPQGTLFFQGYYAEAMWLVTGESRTWNNKFFYFNRVSPLRPLRFRPGSGASGPGAWELALRFSHLDTSNKAVRAGVINSVTLGVNWYLNTNAKIQCNYDYAQIGNKSNGGQGHVHSLGIRSAFDF